MAAPTWTTGEVLYASDVNAWFVPLVGLKTADLGRVATTQTLDPDLQVTLASGSQYQISCVLFYKCTSASGAQFAWTWQVPTGSSAGLYAATYLGGGGGAVVGECDQWTDTTHTGGITTANKIYSVIIQGTIDAGTSGGVFGLTWGCSVSGGTLTLTARSHLLARRIS